MLRIAIAGASGRMGRAICEQAPEHAARVTGALVRSGSERVGEAVSGVEGLRYSDDPDTAFQDAEVVLDFSTPGAASTIAEHCVAQGRALLVGTTGLDDSTRATLQTAGRQIPVLLAPNTSPGVNLLAALVEKVAGMLGEDYDIEITEAHHRHKVDAPSGTALRLGEAAAAGRGIDHSERAVHARQGQIGPREAGDIGYSVIRGGDIPGEHSVLFAGPGERIELGHRASSRATFAVGALRAAAWLAGKPAGFYTMDDMLGLDRL